MNPEVMAKHLAPVIREYVERELTERDARIAALEARLESSLKYRGAYQRAEQYKRGDAVTCDGNLWFCLKDVEGAAGKPGHPDAAQHWQGVTRNK